MQLKRFRTGFDTPFHKRFNTLFKKHVYIPWG